MTTAGIPINNVTVSREKDLIAHLKDGVHSDKEGNVLLAEEMLKFILDNQFLDSVK